ncbi:MAG: hypothetical protein RLZZ200_1256 [Pseudomonadota bacterium]
MTRHLGWLLAALLLLLPLIGGATLRGALRYDRAKVEAGELWRLATGHLVHLDAQHALLNAAGLLLLGALFAGIAKLRYWLSSACLSVAAIDGGFWWHETGLAWYVGASGVLHGLMAAGTMALWRRGESIAWPVAAVFTAKLVWENVVGPLPLETGGSVIVAAHAWGALGGLVAACLPVARRAVILRAIQPQGGA